MQRNRIIALLALILVLAAGLRVINLDGRSLWYDEAFAVLFAEKGLDAMLYGTLTPVDGGAADIHPLFYYTTLNIWMQFFGQSPFAVRLWSVLLGVMYLLGRDLFGQTAGLAAALITGIAPFHVQYSQETRMYALLGLLLAAATWCFVRATNAAGRNRWRWWAAFGVLAGLAMYTQQLAAFYLVALALIPVIRRRPEQIAGIAAGGGIAIVIYLPWLVNLPAQFSKVRSYYWLSSPNIAQPLLTIRSFLTVNLDIPAPGSLIGFVGSLFVVLFLAIQLVMYLRRRRASSDRRALFLVVWLAGMPVVLMWLVSQVQPLYLERALLPAALMLYVALAWLFTRSGLPRPIAVLVGLVGLVLVAVGLYYQYSWATFPNSPFQQAVAYIRNNWQSGDVVVHQNKLTALPMIYYGRELEQRYIGDLPGSPQDTLAVPTQDVLQIRADECVQTAARDGTRIWWIAFDFADEQYAAANRPEFRDAVDWLADHYEVDTSTDINDLEIVLYKGDENRVLEAVCTVPEQG